MIQKLYPGGKQKAFNVTYDDGVLQDIRFVELLNKYHKAVYDKVSPLIKDEEIKNWLKEATRAI